MDEYNVRTGVGKADNAADAMKIAEDIKKSNPDAEIILKAKFMRVVVARATSKKTGFKAAFKF